MSITDFDADRPPEHGRRRRRRGGGRRRRGLHEVGMGDGSREGAVVEDVELWCARVATELRTFTDLGAPWAR